MILLLSVLKGFKFMNLIDLINHMFGRRNHLKENFSHLRKEESLEGKFSANGEAPEHQTPSLRGMIQHKIP